MPRPKFHEKWFGHGGTSSNSEPSAKSDGASTVRPSAGIQIDVKVKRTFKLDEVLLRPESNCYADHAITEFKHQTGEQWGATDRTLLQWEAVEHGR